MDKFVKIWRFDDAPKQYQELSTQGGDEDWLAFIPDSIIAYYFPFLEEGTSFGVCNVSHYDVEDGLVVIGSHA